MRNLGVCCLWLCLVAGDATAQEPATPGETDGPVGAAAAGFAVQEAFGRGDYARLDSLITGYCTASDRLDDGRWQLSGVVTGLAEMFFAYAEWEMMFRKLAEWRVDQPDSASVDMVEAILWRSWAWSARGTGYADTVQPEGWKLFHERLAAAANVLTRVRGPAAGCPWYHELQLQVLLGQGADRQAMQKVYVDGVKRFPDYYPIYYQQALALTPRWGGSYEELQAFIDDAAMAYGAAQADALYTRLWWWIDQREPDLSFELFRETPASWPRMKKGFEQLIAKHPRSNWMLNSYGAYACRAGDAATYRQVRGRMRRPYYNDAWPRNYTIEVCDSRLLRGS